MTIAYQQRRAAETELTKALGSSTIVEEEIMREAEEAVNALSTLLGDGSWFFTQEKPGLFDASVFAYTHLLLSEDLAWNHNRLGEQVKGYQNLVQHQARILESDF